MLRFAIVFLSLTMMPTFAGAAPLRASTVEATVTIKPEVVLHPLSPTLFGVNIHPHAKANIAKPEVMETVKKLGFKSCRFPNGCVADLYDWKNPRDGWASVDDFLNLCDILDAEPYYTLNLQGGTEGLTGPAPANLPLEETIKYQHLMPNPCGNTNYTFHTLADTLELMQKYTIDRALAGKRPILHYEMGNENWGQSRTDWPPEVYAKTVEVWSKAMRDLLAESAKKHPELAPLKLYIVGVGYPIMGNNMRLVDNPDRDINVPWTAGLNRLYEQGAIDAVQEHFYPYGVADGGTLVWAAHNLSNLIHTRKGISNPRLSGYLDKPLAYTMPMEHTEWNIKCWGPRFSVLEINNGGFEDGLEGWEVSGRTASAVSWAARRGSKGVRLTLRPGDPPLAISQLVQLKGDMKVVTGEAWVRTDKADALKLSWEYNGHPIGGWHTTTSERWERIVGSAVRPDTATAMRLVLRVTEPATVYVDEVSAHFSTDTTNHNPMSAEVYEQALFCVDALRAMALAGAPRSHVHHLFGNYPCGTLLLSGEMRDQANAFLFFSGAYGKEVVSAECAAETFSYASAVGRWSSHFNALVPDLTDVPSLACLASRRGDTLYLMLLNRTSDRDIVTTIDLGATAAGTTASVRTLSGTDIELAGSTITEGTTPVNGRTIVQTVAPYSAQILTVELKGERQ